jgi:hypothetical protein
MISIVTDEEELWGQYADIEHGYSFQEQKVVFFSKPKPKSSPKPKPISLPIHLPILIPILIPVVNLCASNLTDKCHSYHTSKKYEGVNNKPLPYRTEPFYNDDSYNDDSYNPALNKIIERQIYLGCIICLLTVGLFILP